MAPWDEATEAWQRKGHGWACMPPKPPICLKLLRLYRREAQTEKNVQTDFPLQYVPQNDQHPIGILISHIPSPPRPRP